MTDRDKLKEWVYQDVLSNGGEAAVINVAKYIWDHHETELRKSGDLFYSWQYDMRWAAQKLRDAGQLTLNGRKWAVRK